MDSQRRLLVDGANVMHAWPELKALLPGKVTVARKLLQERLQLLHDSGLAAVQLVFDGRGGETVMETLPGNPPMVVIHTATGQTADDVIEQLVSQSKDPSNCTVATADRMVRQTIEAAGAHAIQPDDLAAWIQSAETRQSSKLSTRRQSNDAKWRRRPPSG